MTVRDVAKALRGLSGKVLLLTHHNADLDAVASTVALHSGLKRLGIAADCGAAESIAKPAQRLASGTDFILDPDCSKYGTVVLVETSVPEQLHTVPNLRADIIIDHHPPGKLAEKAKVAWIDESQKSASQMIFRLLKELEVDVDARLSTVLAVGMVADTAHLRIAELNEFEILLELLRSGARWAEILRLLETPTDKSESIAVLISASRMELWKIGDLVLAFSHVKSHEAAAARGLVKLGADVAVVVAEKEEEVRISSRGRKWISGINLDLSMLFREVGRLIGGSGGGHPEAGSANGYDKKGIEPALKFIRREIERTVGKQGKRLE